ncbi:hypothetical protein [Salinicoccus roseus]|uniref:hypothetical protein n=1 Tax=Salinicoccus roseus TaxID=45670 RepID=UPI00230176B0|nr:hypothetical protein [Salinicoccus roseus]
MDTTVVFELHIKTDFQDEEFVRREGSKRIGKRDYDEMERVKKEYENEFFEELKDSNERNSGFIKLESNNKSIRFFNISRISYFYVTANPKDY